MLHCKPAKIVINNSRSDWFSKANTLVWAEPCAWWAELKMLSFWAGGISSFPPCTREYRLLRRLGWEPLQTERKKAKTKMMYKVLNKTGPKSLTNLFSYKSEKTNYHLRDISSSLCLPKPRTNNMKKSFMYDGAHLWNSIPKEIRESKSLSSFRNKIAAHIIA